MKRAHSSEETRSYNSSRSSSPSPSPDSRFKEVIIIDSENSGRAKETDQQKYIKFEFGKITTLECLDRLVTIPKETTSLNIGNISYGPIMFPDSFANLVKLELGGIYKNELTITLPNLLPNLKKLILGHISGTIKLPKLMDGLEKLEIGVVGYDTTLKLPDSLNGLKTFSIVDVMADAVCELPNKLDNITTLKIGEPSYQAKNFKLPDSLPNLTSLIIGNILRGYALQLPKCDNLSRFTLNGIYSNGTFNLPETLNHLTSFTIKCLCGASIILPNSVSNMNYTIQEIRRSMNIDLESKITLPNQLNKPTTLDIGCIQHGATLRIVDPSHNLTILIFEKIEAYVTIVLPDSSKNLTTLIIKTMEQSAILQSADLLENLNNIQNVRIGTLIGEDARKVLRGQIKALDSKCSIQ